MKVKAHIRIARNRSRAKVAATVKPTTTPLYDSHNAPLPTVAFAVVFDVPDAMFKQAEQIIATLTIPESQAHIAADVVELAP